jgi:hypothetical protein
VNNRRLPDQSSEPSSAPGTRSSRIDERGAGWGCEPLEFPKRKGFRSFKWLEPAPLWRSRNDRLIRWFKDDPTNQRRQAWMESLGLAGADPLIDYSEESPISFVVMGDTGEGDHSQEAVAFALETQRAEASFAFICSDVIYPAGGVREYDEKYFGMYEGLGLPFYAVPGNHDWYDDGVGFMRWMCGATTRPAETDRSRFPRRGWWRRLLWRRPPKPWPEEEPIGAHDRTDLPESRRQRSPYFCLDAGPLRLVCIDTGISGVRGELDRDQGEWLKRVSAGPQPKILLTGKPLYVDGRHHPGSIEGGGTVDEIVRNPANNYIAAIGGDIHNYQRYPVTVDDGRTLMYVVSGGGGAFMHETHSIENLEREKPKLKGTSEEKLRLYPRRGDCLSRFSQLYAHKFRFLGGRFLYIPPLCAERLVAEHYGMSVTRPEAEKAKVTRRMRLAKAILFALPGRGRKGLHIPFAEWLDWDEPPFFKHFLRVDAAEGEVRIRCFAAIGCKRDKAEPAIEDELLAREEDGEWRWQYPSGGAARIP